MTKIIKVTGYLITNDDYIDTKKIATAAGEMLSSKFDCIKMPFIAETSDINNWNDNHELNRYDCPISVCESYFTIPFTSKYESVFKVGQTYEKVGVYGGVTIYTVKEIDRKNNKILLAEKWIDIDGSGLRPAKWHKLEKVDGKERCLEWTSKNFGDMWIYAYTTECNK